MVEIDGIEYLTVREVCDLLEVKPATIYAYVSRGILPSYKQGIKRQRLYRADDIRQLITLRPSLPEAPVAISAQAQVPAKDHQLPTNMPDVDLPDAEGWIGER